MAEILDDNGDLWVFDPQPGELPWWCPTFGARAFDAYLVAEIGGAGAYLD